MNARMAYWIREHWRYGFGKNYRERVAHTYKGLKGPIIFGYQWW